MNSRTLMADTKFYEAYSRYIDSEGRYETWEESIDRVMAMHYKFYKDKLTPKLFALIDDVELAYKKKLFLGAQRALQFGGDQLLKNHNKLYNCFSEDTNFVTKEGIKSFKDFSPGDTCIVPTHTGKWQTAIVKEYGKQQLNNVTIAKGNNTSIIKVTANHRWILNSGKETTHLQINDKLKTVPDKFNLFSWDNAPDIEKLYWCYGLIYGD